jgi:hypothetical protein
VRPTTHGALGEAAAAVWNAENYRALGLLHKLDVPGAAALRARVYLRTGGLALAVREFEARAALAGTQPAESIALATSANFALCANGDFERAETIVRWASSLLDERSDPLLRIERHYMAAAGKFMRGDTAAGDREAAAALELVNRFPHAEAHGEFQWETNHLRARLLDLLGVQAMVRGDFKSQEERLVEALLHVRLVRNREYWLEASLLSNLAVLVKHFPWTRGKQMLVAHAAAIPWNPELDLKRIYIKFGLRQHRRIFGDDTLSGGVLTDTAPSLAWRIYSCVESLLCEEWSDAESFSSEMHYGRSLAERVDFDQTRGEEVSSLLSLAILVATEDPRAAHELRSRYATKMATVSPAYVVVRAPVRVAEEAFADGCIAKGESEFSEARARLDEAARLWAQLGLVQWAAAAGLERYTISRDAADLNAARSFVKQYPATSFGQRLTRALKASARSQTGDFIYVNPWRMTRSDLSRASEGARELGQNAIPR